jgi:hypothetical protein
MKQLTFLLLFTVISFTLNAQENTPVFGVKAGINLSDIHDDMGILTEGLEFTTANYYHFGVFLNHQFSNNLGIGAELLFNQKGAQNNTTINSPQDEDYRLRFDYFSLPVLLKYRVGNFIIEAGPEFSYRYNIAVESDTNVDEDLLKLIWTEDFDIGALLGLSYQIKRLNVGLRYNIGFGKLSEITFTNPNGEPLGDGKNFQNRVLQVSVAYVIVTR